MPWPRTPPPLAWTPTPRRRPRRGQLDGAAELIIPATDTPGAEAGVVGQFVDRAVGDLWQPGTQQVIRSGLDCIEAEARAAHGAAFRRRPWSSRRRCSTGTRSRAAPDHTVAAAGRAELVAAPVGPAALGLAEPPKGPAFPVLKRTPVTVGYFTSQVGRD